MAKFGDYRQFIGASPGRLAVTPIDSEDFGQGSISSPSGVGYNFLSGVVIEVISNPNRFLQSTFSIPDSNGDPQDALSASTGLPLTNRDVLSGREKIDADGNTFSPSIENTHFVDFMPINSIFVKVIDRNATSKSAKPVIAFPFFPPHLSMPVIPGEYVWLVKQDVKGSEIYYWMCRKVGIRQVDDINYTNLERQRPIFMAYDTFFNDSTAVNDDNLDTVINLNANFNGNLIDDDAIDVIHRDSSAYKEEFTGEPVPRYVKRCGDLLLQGSNNASIMLGVEKFESEMTSIGPGVESVTRQGYFTNSEKTPRENRKALAPAIDICIGRKVTDLMSNKLPTSDSIIDGDKISMLKVTRSDTNSDEEYMEIDKITSIREGKETQNPLEFKDDDPYNCIARIYMTNTSNLDNIFNLEDIEDENPAAPADIDGVGNYGGLVMLSSNTRVIGKETIKVHNTAGKSAIIMTSEGDIIIQGNTETGGKIILEGVSGHIRIVPGPTGIVKIGDDFRSVNIGDGTIANSDALVPVAGTTESFWPNSLILGHSLGTVNHIMTGHSALVAEGSAGGNQGSYATKVIIK